MDELTKPIVTLVNSLADALIEDIKDDKIYDSQTAEWVGEGIKVRLILEVEIND